MQITVTLPDDLAAPLLLPGQDPARTALEAIGLEAYRQHRISAYQLRTLLGIPSRYELDGFLKEHRVETYTAEDFEHDLATIRHIEEIRKAERRA
ncbi:MAG TPA: UPF0175 family protein [Candidatus Acidoferrales bacterium]|nr:UPF0175 family protein [Candidatus Acidoferrales bacterium]